MSEYFKQILKIANPYAAAAFPTTSTTLATWIYNIFNYHEPVVIEEIIYTCSKITISFDR
jgi:hypothetical protein